MMNDVGMNLVEPTAFFFFFFFFFLSAVCQEPECSNHRLDGPSLFFLGLLTRIQHTHSAGVFSSVDLCCPNLLGQETFSPLSCIYPHT
ncbi:putative signal peptide protein [Puccinia sorghi]|uniref:Putative signal peptide protein n=1 Tax=Puccinia sorghi TaxID=27349 RepID=A0A0L6V6G9_9BASI|nr:putative signal peptide protein [Puccinia sorghi]